MILAVGPIALGLAVAALVPRALAPADAGWSGLVVLAGAAMFWWALAWVGRGAGTPPVAMLTPALLLLAVFLIRPMSAGLAFFSGPFASREELSPALARLVLDRELTLVATQKLLVVLLLAAPLWQAVGLRPWSRRWFELATLAGVAVLLLMAAIQLGAGSTAFNAEHPEPLLSVLAGAACWLAGTIAARVRAWDRARLGHVVDAWGERLRNPDFLTAALAAVLLVGVATLVLASLAGPVRWPSLVPWTALAIGAMVLANARKPAVVALAAALLAEAAMAVGVGWPGRLLAHSVGRGGWFGWSHWDVQAGEHAGLLAILQARGVISGLLLAGALAAAAAFQVRRLRRGEGPERAARAGAMAGSWLIVASWLIGPAQVRSSAALLALLWWAMSLGAAPASRPRRRRAANYHLWLAAMVVFCYGLLGLANMAHPRLWLAVPAQGGDKVLHAAWGLYVTLTCCLALAPWGRWIAITGGLAGSMALAVAAEFAQRQWLADRSFEWADVGAYGVSAVLVAAALLMAPFRWGRSGPQVLPAAEDSRIRL